MGARSTSGVVALPRNYKIILEGMADCIGISVGHILWSVTKITPALLFSGKFFKLAPLRPSYFLFTDQGTFRLFLNIGVHSGIIGDFTVRFISSDLVHLCTRDGAFVPVFKGLNCCAMCWP